MGNPNYKDDPTILNEHELWRRISAEQYKFDDNIKRFRPTSGAFDDSSNDSPMSVDLAEMRSGPHESLANHQGDGLVAITAGLVRECSLGIMRDPLDENPAHALVFGKKTRGVKRRLAFAARIIIPPSEK